MSNAIVWQPLIRCGEISIAPDLRNPIFNCAFCSNTCLDMDSFIRHLNSHRDSICQTYPVKITNNAELNNINDASVAHMPEYTNLKVTPDIVTLTSGLNVLYTPENTNLAAAHHLWPKAEMVNLVQINPLNAATTIYTTNSTITTAATTCFSPSSPTTDTSCQTCSGSECENADGEDSSGLVLVQTPSVAEYDGDGVGKREGSGVGYVGGGISSGFSDCMSLNEDSTSKSMNIIANNEGTPMEEDDENTEVGSIDQEQSSDYSRINLNSTETSMTNDGNNERNVMDDDNENTENGSIDQEHSLDYSKLKPNNIKTAAMRNALDNKNVVSYLLDLYRKNEQLWNPEHPSYRYNAKRSVYNALSKPLLEDMNVNLTGVEIFGMFNILRARYRRELVKFEERKGKHRSRLWYFEKLDFLRKVIVDKRNARLRERKELSNRVSVEATHRQIVSFIIGEYKKFTCLWNTRDEVYDTIDETEIYDEIGERLYEEHNIVLTAKEIQNEVKKIRIRYRRELRLAYKMKGLYVPKLWCFDEMEFLRPIMEARVLKYLKKDEHHSTAIVKSKNELDKVLGIEFPGLEQQLQFIDIYQKYTALWDVDHPDYRSTNYRNEALKSMLEEVKSAIPNMNITLEQLEKTINQMRKDFSTEKLKRIKVGEDGANANDLGATKMSSIIYEKLSVFLAINLGPFRCEVCRHICKTCDNYKIHKSKHDGTLPFICTLCGKGFQMPGNLTIHIRRHRRDYPYACDICQKAFATSTETTIHMRSHTGERPYVCNVCDKTFKTWSFFDVHKRTHLKQSNFHCPICDKSFYERNRFTDHMNVHLNIRKHRCEQCGKGFTTIGNLKKHMDLHAPTKKYKCESCNKSFAQSASLSWHKKAQHEHDEKEI